MEEYSRLAHFESIILIDICIYRLSKLDQVSRWPKARVICRACGERGHQRKSSKKCLKSTNPDSEHCKTKGSLESRPALEGECV